MSKSLKNFITIREILKKYSRETFRLLVLQNHYRSPLNFSDKGLKAVQDAVTRLKELIVRLEGAKDPLGTPAKKPKTSSKTISLAVVLLEKFNQYMEDDFNSPKAIAEMFAVAKKTNTLLDKQLLTRDEAHEIVHAFKKIDSVFGIIPETMRDAVPEEVKKLASEREQYRKEKNWKKSDELRSLIEGKGYVVKDGQDGPVLKPR